MTRSGPLIRVGGRELRVTAMLLHRYISEPDESFGEFSERVARFFGTWQFIIGQTIIVALWIVANAADIVFQWDKYPFILLNLAFSTQAAYAAPLILLAQTRQADRDKIALARTEWHREIIAARQARVTVWCSDPSMERAARLRGIEEIWSDTVPGPLVDLIPDPPMPSELVGHVDERALHADLLDAAGVAVQAPP